jgi:hypothetical protein
MHVHEQRQQQDDEESESEAVEWQVRPSFPPGVAV